MIRTIVVLTCLVALACALPIQERSQAESAQAKFALPTKFDPARDPEKDLQEVIAEAKRTHKRIILDVGGEWCGWCHTLDRFFDQNADLMRLREQNYLWLKINFSPENQNKKFLSGYPAIHGYPHLFVLDQDGRLLHSQGTAELELGKSYDLKKMTEFLNKWAPPSQ